MGRWRSGISALLMVLGTLAGYSSIPAGAMISSSHVHAAHPTPARPQDTSAPFWLTAFDMSTPQSFVVFHHTPEVLSRQSNAVILWQYRGQHWNRLVIAREAASTTIGAFALECQGSVCLAAIATQSGPRAAVTIWRTRTPGGPWHRTAYIPISPYVAQGDSVFELAGWGSTVWLLDAGSPGAGLMPKALWVSPNLGSQWSLVASDGLPAHTAALPIPQGYPTGIVADGPGRVLLSTSPRGNSGVVAVSYTLHPRTAHVLAFPIPARYYLESAYPALIHAGTLTIPIVASAPREPNNDLVWARQSSPQAAWTVHRAGPASGDPGIAGDGTLVVVNNNNLAIRAPGQPTIRMPYPSYFTANPLVAAVIAHRRVLALGQNGTLWVNTLHGTWRRYDAMSDRTRPRSPLSSTP